MNKEKEGITIREIDRKDDLMRLEDKILEIIETDEFSYMSNAEIVGVLEVIKTNILLESM